MATTQIAGNRQVKALSITNAEIDAAAAIALSKLAEAVIQADGGQAFTADQSLGGFKLTSVGAPSSGGDAANKTYVDNAVTGLLDYKGGQDCSANPNYPAASKGDAYYVSVAGKIGGASGKSVEVGDVFVANADNAGGNEATVGTSWFVMEHNLVGALVASNNLSDLASASTARTNLGMSANMSSLVVAADYAAARALLDLEAGTDFYSVSAADSLLAAKAPLASPTFTGTPAAPTAAPGTNTTQVATTAFVTAAVAAIGGGTKVTRETPTGTINGSNVTFTLSHTPVSGTEEVFLNGILQEPGSGNDYTISSGTITYLTAPVSGDRLRVSYVY